MKKLGMTVILVLLLSGCSMLDRGNYEKDRLGYVLVDDLIVNYHTNSIGEIDVFMIDQVMSFFEALDYVDFDDTLLNQEDYLDSSVTIQDLSSCGLTSSRPIPRFIRIEDQTYYYHVRANGYCSYDEYNFQKNGYTEEILYVVEETSPIEDLNTTLFREADFKINTFDTVIFIETISYSADKDEWEKTIVSVLPMSIKQAGGMYEDNSDFIEQVGILEKYVLDNQSVNLLELSEDYLNEEVNNIWSDATIERLGRDHDVIKTVRIKKTGDILDIINDTLARLGMFS